MPRRQGNGGGGGALTDLPAETESVAEGAFEGCVHVTGIRVDAENRHFAAQGGVLYTSDLAEAVVAPAGIGDAVTIAPEAKRIGKKAFAGCEKPESIVALGSVEDIAADAFAQTARDKAVVALAPGEDYDARKAVWKAAGFQSFAEQAVPGETMRPDGQPDAEDPGEEGDSEADGFVYRLLEDFTLEVSWEGRESPASDLAVPASAKVGGIAYNVTAVAPGAFARFTSLTKVTLPSSIKRVGDGAFEGCSALESVLLPEGLESIGAGAFAGTALVHVTLPSTLRDLAAGRAFADCAALRRVLALSNGVQVAADTLAGCQGAVVWMPWSQSEQSPWDEAVADGRNSVVRYGLSLSADPLRLEVGQKSDLFDGGVREVPDGAELAYSYAAMPISVEAGMVTGKKPGTSEVAAALSLEGRELARATRTVEVVPASEEPQAPEGDGGEEGAEGDEAADDGLEGEEPAGEDLDPDAEAPAEGEEEEARDEAANEDPAEPVVPDHAILRTTAQLSEEPMAAAEIAPYAAGDTFVSGNYLYTMLADGTVSIGHANTSVPTGTSTTLPSSVSYGGKSYTVSAITARGFAGNTGLKKVVLPSSIKTIGEEAFKGASLLTGCNMSATSITAVPNGCFMNCPKLAWSSTKFPSTATSLGNSAFRNCTTLRQAELPASIKQVGAYAYAGCVLLGKDVSDTEVRYVRFPSVKRIEEGTFQGCTGMQWSRVKLATDLEYIGPYAFEGCSGLGAIGTGIRNYAFPDTLTYIGPYAFANCTGAVNAVLPSSITRIEEGTFQGCTKLSWNGVDGSAGFQAKGAISYIGNNAFKGCTNIKGTVDFSRGGKVLLASEVIIGNSAFEGSGIGKLSFPSNIVDIGVLAFKDCTSLTSVDLLSNIKVIKDQVFRGCTNLETVFNADSVTVIGGGAFQNCAKLKSLSAAGANAVAIGGLANVERVGRDAFSDCTSLSSIDFGKKFGSKLTTIEVCAFKNSGLTSFEMPSGVTTVSQQAFKDCTKLATVTGMENVTSIDVEAFNNCSALSSIPFGSKLETIGGWAFQGCTSLTISEMPESLKGLGGSAFRNCSAITSMVLYPGLTFVGDSAFKNCPITKAVCLGSSYNTDGVDIFSGLNMNLHCLKSTADFWKSHTRLTNVTSGEGMTFSPSKLTLDYKGSNGTVKIKTAPTAANDFTGFYMTWAEPNNAVASRVSGGGSWQDRVYSPKGIGTTTVKVSLSYAWADGAKSVSFGDIAQFDIQVSPYTYKIVYKANGGNGSDYTQTMTYGQAQKVKSYSECGFTWTACTSTWWSTTPSGDGGTPYYPGYSINLDPGANATVTLYARWRYIQYNINYDGNGATGGASPGNRKVNYDTVVSLPNCTWTKKGYTFTGSWNTDPNGKGTSYNAGQSVSKLAINENETYKLYAQWRLNNYKVSFNANTGSGTVSNPISTSWNSNVTMPGGGNLAKKGYAFAGWNTQADGKGTTYEAGKTYQNLTTSDNVTVPLYAKWVPKQYTVNFCKMSASVTGSDPAPITANYDATITIPACQHTLTGHHFAGWNASDKLDRKNFQPGTSVKISEIVEAQPEADTRNGVIYLTGNLQGNTYKIAFNTNGGTGSAPSQVSTYYNTDIAMPSGSGLSKKGYTFGGWSTQENGSGTVYEAGKAYRNLTANNNVTVTLYAKWVPKQYTVYFVKGIDAATGNATSLVTNYDATITMPASSFSLKGYHFTGWNPRAELDGTNWAASAGVKVTDILAEQPEADNRGNVIYLHANFKPNTYIITVDGYYQTHPDFWRWTFDAEYDKDVTIPQLPTESECSKNGYTATQWRCTHADGTKTYHKPGEVVKKANFATGDPGEAEDAVWLVPDWKANPYKIRFDANKPEGSTLKGSMADLAMTYDTAKNLTKNVFTCEADGKRIAFMGWNTKADGTGDAYADQAEAKNLASDKDAVVTLYAQWKEVVVIDVTAPIKPLIGVEMFTGDIRTAASSFSSRSVADVRLAKAECQAGADVEKVFPECSEGIELTMTDGDGNDLALKLGQAKELAVASTPQFKIAKGSSTNPSKLDVEFGLNLPEGTTWQPQDGPQDFASVTYTFDLANEAAQ